MLISDLKSWEETLTVPATYVHAISTLLVWWCCHLKEHNIRPGLKSQFCHWGWLVENISLSNYWHFFGWYWSWLLQVTSMFFVHCTHLTESYSNTSWKGQKGGMTTWPIKTWVIVLDWRWSFKRRCLLFLQLRQNKEVRIRAKRLSSIKGF